MPDPAVTIGLWIVALAVSLVGGWRIAATRGWLPAVVIVLFRGTLLCLAAWLLWLACRPREEKITGRPVDTKEENVVLFLQDLSQSMAFMTAEGRSRGALAEETWREFRELARQKAGHRDHREHRAVDAQHEKRREAGGPKASVSSVSSVPSVATPRRMFFARNLVSERDSAKIRSDATHMVQALTECLGREEVRAVVVVSDGASTDGAVPEHVLDWARNRGVSMYAICAADPAGEIADASVQETDCPVTNPLRIDVRVACEGSLVGQAAKLELSVDGVLRQTREVGLRERATYQLDVPELERGWHAYAVRLKLEQPEITALNNVAYGVFRVAPAQTLLYLVGRPRPDHRHVVRMLRGLWPERLRVMHARGGKLAPADGPLKAGAPKSPDTATEINARNVRLVVLADVAPRDLPPPLLEAMDRGKVVSMVLAGDTLARWTERDAGSVPVAGTGRVLRLGGDEDEDEDDERPGAARAGRVIAGQAAELCGLGDLKLDGVRLSHIHDVTLRSPSRVLMWVTDPTSRAEGRRPLLVVDRTVSPRSVVLLTDVAWKWALHPEPKVRAAYGEMWHGLTRWILVEDLVTDPLDISFMPHPRDPDTTLVRVVAKAASPGPSADSLPVVPVAPGGPDLDLQNVRLVVTVGDDGRGTRSTARPRPRGGAYVLPFTCKKRPRVVWFQAFAVRRGVEVRSARKPLPLPVSNMEFLDIKPYPERMAKYVPGKEHFACWRDRGRVLERALEFRETKPVEFRKSVEERKAGKEMALALVCFLVVACEWFIERRAYAGTERKQG